MEIYLDEYICDKLDLSYYEGHKDPNTLDEVNLQLGTLLYHRRCWDIKHRKIFANYVASGEPIRVAPAIGPGWYTVTNYPENKKSDKLIDILDDGENPIAKLRAD